MTLREAAMTVWESYLNVPYSWGGDDPLDGVDCSGFAQEGLRAVGLLPRSHDYTADSLLHVAFLQTPREKEVRRLRRGMLVFWARPDKTIRHVEVVWQVFPDRVLTIGASGGGSMTTSREVAIQQNAYVKISPLGSDWYCAVDPFPNPF